MSFDTGSMGIKVQKIVDVLETEGEQEWATKIDEAYYSHVGIDAVRAALGRLRELQRDADLIERLELTESVAGVIGALSLAAGEDQGDAQGSGSAPETARKLLESLKGDDDVSQHQLGAAADGARRLLDTLRDERS